MHDDVTLVERVTWILAAVLALRFFARSAFVLVAMAALAVFAFHASLGGKPLLGRLALEDEAAA